MARKADAQGGNGNVYFDHEKGTARKYLRNTSSPDKALRFMQELDVLKEIESQSIPNIVKIENVFLDKDKIAESYIEMKKYDGSLYDLFDITKGNVIFSLRLILPIIKALQTLASNSPMVFHRDIKPDNILYLKENDEYSLYLTDFGTCFLKDENERLTPPEMAIGPRMFIAPEYEVGRVEDVDEKGDIFSIGKVIWCMINGEKEEFLPSNFWFAPEYDLVKRYPTTPDMLGANVIISSCLAMNPTDRCDYSTLITQIEAFLSDRKGNPESNMKQKVMQFQEKRKMELLEIKEKNRLLVNRFSQCYVEALEILLSEYREFELLQILHTEYIRKSTDGIDYTSVNVENNSAHYLYSRTYDRIYLSINYNPAKGEEKYCNITFGYSISSPRLNNGARFYFTNNQSIECVYHDISEPLCVNAMVNVINMLISDYITEK